MGFNSGLKGLREEHRLKLFENRMLKKIFGPKRNEITEEWRRLHNEELYMFSSPDVMWATRLRRMSWVMHVSCVAERNLYRVLVGKPEGKSPPGRPR
jgi:hypothetical protein